MQKDTALAIALREAANKKGVAIKDLGKPVTHDATQPPRHTLRLQEKQAKSQPGVNAS